MTKPEWGTKRKCVSCNAMFYDMRSSAMTCPKCGKTFSLDDLKEATKLSAKESKASVKKEPDDDLLVKDDFFEEVDEDNLDVLEDPADLGDDNHDMSEVMDNVDMADDKEL